MNLPQALEIVKDHIRIGKGMELTNGVPEALEIIVEELERLQRCYEVTNESWKELMDELLQHKKALELACDMIAKDFNLKARPFYGYFLAQAKGGSNETERTSETP